MSIINYQPMAGGFGARVELDPARSLTPDEARQIAKIFHKHMLVYFERAEMTMQQLAQFVMTFGQPDDPRGRLASSVSEYAGIRVVENVEKGKFGPRSNS